MKPEYMADFLDTEQADIAFRLLKEELNWERRDDAPRFEYWTNIFNIDYSYGRGRGLRTYQSQKSHKIIDIINNAIFEKTDNTPFEACFLNMYFDQSDALGWHADDEPKIDHTRPIAVVSLGEERIIQTKPVDGSETASSQLLGHGSLFLMPAGFQQTHLHRIPKGGREMGTRISLTYRALKL